MSQNFDGWLENELERGFATLSARPVPTEPRYRAQRGSLGLASAGRRRFLMPLLATALMAGGGTAAAATGTNPVVLGQQISEGVVTCKDQLGGGQQGIGECISEVVAAQRAAAENPPAVRKPAFVERAAPGPAQPEPAAKQTRGVEPINVMETARDKKEPNENHGSDVSEVARSGAPGRELGEAVSAAARANRPDGGPDGVKANGRPDQPGEQGRGQGPSNGNQGNGNGRDRASSGANDIPSSDPRPGNSENGQGRGRGPNR